MKDTRLAWKKILKDSGAFIRIKQKLTVSPHILRKVITLIPVRLNSTTSSEPNIPLCLSLEQKDVFRGRLHTTHISHAKARTLLNSIYKRSVTVFGELSNPLGDPLFALNFDDDSDED